MKGWATRKWYHFISIWFTIIIIFCIIHNKNLIVICDKSNFRFYFVFFFKETCGVVLGDMRFGPALPNVNNRGWSGKVVDRSGTTSLPSPSDPRTRS
jgi:hypothetical protein